MDDQNTQSTVLTKKWPLILPVVAAIVIVALALNGKKDEDANTVANDEPVQEYTYANGEYSVEGSYVSPGGQETLPVTLTLENDIIVDAEVTVNASNPMTERFQGIFVENYKSLVIGKKLDEVELDNVSGSSLTPQGFNDAVAKIKAEAAV